MSKKSIKDWNRGRVIEFLRQSEATIEDVRTIIELFETNKNMLQIEPNIQGKDGTNILTKAVITKNLKLLELAINHEADVDICDASGINALQIACKLGSSKMVELLLEKGANVNCKSLKNDYTPISYVFFDQGISANNYIETIKLLVKYKANVNAPYIGASALMMTSGLLGDYESGKLLNENKADVNFKYLEDTVWSVTENEDIKMLLMKTPELDKEKILPSSYTRTNFRISFEEKCKKDIHYLGSGKTIFWDVLIKMLTYYMIGYQANNPRYANKVGEDNDAFFSIKSYGVKNAIEKYMANNWFLSFLQCKDSRAIEVKNEQDKLIKIFVPKLVWSEIGKLLFAEEVEKIIATNLQNFQENVDSDDEVIGDLFDDH